MRAANEYRQVIVYPRGQLTAQDRKRLTAAGIIVIEADDPKSVVTIIPASSIVSTDDLLMAALNAVGTSEYSAPQSKFAKELFRRLDANDKAKGSR